MSPRTISPLAGLLVSLVWIGVGMCADRSLLAGEEPQPLSPLPTTITLLAARRFAPRDTSELEAKLMEAFERRDCTTARSLITPVQYERLSAVALAAVASCQSDPLLAENLFTLAERSDPANDVALALHAQYLWQRDRGKARPLWERVLRLGRDVTIRVLARAYLEGTANGNESLISSRHLTYYLSAQLGLGYETNPGVTSVTASKTSTGSADFNALATAGAQYPLSIGSVAANYAFTYTRYFSNGSADLLQNDADLPLTFRAGTNVDLKLRPFGTLSYFGEAPYYVLGGLAVQGVTYRGDYRQTVQGSVFNDHFFNRLLVNQQGTHFRFDYSWELTPDPLYLRASISLEHVAAGVDRFTNPPQLISYSHNDIGVDGMGELNLQWILVGFYAKLLTRQDDNNSIYPHEGNPKFSKRRQDLQVILQPSIAFPLAKNAQIFAFYKWNHRFSNTGASDYADRNFDDQSVGAAARIFFGTF